MRLITLTALCLSVAQAHAFNALGHKVIADIAWSRLKPERQHEIVEILRRHPRYDEDFAKQMPADAADEGRWVFQQAATWPDIARGLKGADRQYDHPTWHYVNFPLRPDVTRNHAINLSTEYPTKLPAKKWNVSQAVKAAQAKIASDATPAEKAIAYCWLLHLVGDLHQPMHSTALFCDRFPAGDRGGNSIPLVQGENLHSLWDNLLGRSHKPNDVKREVVELVTVPAYWRADLRGDVDDWIQESHQLAIFAYDPSILARVEQPGPLAPINVSEDYLRAAGQRARGRVVAAGMRLAALLGAPPGTAVQRQPAAPAAKQAESLDAFAPQSLAPTTRPASKLAPAKSLGDYWLNTNTNVRHNRSCRNFGKTTNGRECSADEGKPCGLCGG